MDKITFKRDTVHLIAPQGARAMVINVIATLQSTLRPDPKKELSPVETYTVG